MPRLPNGVWSSQFGRPSAYAAEIARARDLPSTWSIPRFGDQADVIIQKPPGFRYPAWGSDADFIYLLRPEGVWRLRRDPSASGRPLLVMVDDPGVPLSSRLLLPAPPPRTSGWVLEERVMASANEIDEESSPAAQGAKVDADEMGATLWDVVDGALGRTTVAAGDAFSHGRLGFSLKGRWLVGRELATGRRVAWDVWESRAVRGAVERGRLSLRFDGAWASSVDVQVVIAAPMEGSTGTF